MPLENHVQGQGRKRGIRADEALKKWSSSIQERLKKAPDEILSPPPSSHPLHSDRHGPTAAGRRGAAAVSRFSEKEREKERERERKRERKREKGRGERKIETDG